MWKRRGLNGTDGLIGRWTKFVQGPRIVIAWRERESVRAVLNVAKEKYTKENFYLQSVKETLRSIGDSIIILYVVIVNLIFHIKFCIVYLDLNLKI